MEFIVYVKTDSTGHIVAVDSSAFLTDLAGWVEVDRGCGVRFYHAQTAYFKEPIWTDGGAYRYRLADGKAVECTPEEIAEQQEAMKHALTPTTDDVLNALLGVSE